LPTTLDLMHREPKSETRLTGASSSEMREAESEEGKIPFAAHASEVRDVEGDFLSPITQII
jgi:hypothetical protein